MDCPISIFAELPESVYKALQQWLDRHPGADQSSAIADALKLLLTSETK